MSTSMAKHFKRSFIGFTLLLLASASLLSRAELTDLSQTPLANDAGSSVRPNMMFILDNSGSMNFNFTPDNVSYDASINGGSTAIQANRGNREDVCRRYVYSNGWTTSSTAICGGANSVGSAPTDGGDPPFYSPQFNTAYYNPEISYKPPVNPCNTAQSLPDMTDWSNVLVQGHDIDGSCIQTAAAGKTNLLTHYPERVYCLHSYSGESSSECKRNGINDTGAAGDYDYPNSTYKYAKTLDSHPHYFLIEPYEYCSDNSLKNCSANPKKNQQIPSYVRYCTLNKYDGSPTTTCQAKFDDAGYITPRFGNFIRHDIVPTITSYPKAAGRSDCAGSTCTYAEEMTNFANWYAYYRTRMQSMKSSASLAFNDIDDTFRVGLVTINPARAPQYSSPVLAEHFLKIDDFNTEQKKAWLMQLYAQTSSGGTPLRGALSRVGRYFGNRHDGINIGMDDDPVKYACQPNFALLTTDGYWNKGTSNNDIGVKLNGSSSVGNQDNSNSGYSTRAIGAYDGGVSGADNTLADVAMYYYKTDLRGDFDDKVPTSDKDTAPHQHMVTFTLGLGLDGDLDYRSDYETAIGGDFADIKAGSLKWPKPVADTPTALDDLWHAAVNGRGIYFSAKDPESLTAGIKGALGGATVKTGAAAASATSSPNITPNDNFIYSSTYRTVHWDGEVEAKTIDTQTGEVLGSVWKAQAQLDGKGNGRTIYKMNKASPSTMSYFDWNDLSTAEQGYFKDKCNWPECNSLDETAKASANAGPSLVAYLRGDNSNEDTGVADDNKAFRNREHLLGDTVNAMPAFVKSPRFNFADDGYKDFKIENASRQAMLYIAANDGMLHALNADTGGEVWAYVPNIVMQNMHYLADPAYSEPGKHRYFVDGSPQVMDIKDGSTWKTILVGGLNAGGRGYYALDITKPDQPKPLWEFCYDSKYCNVSDPDIGFSYGNPVIAKLPEGNANAGKWAVMVTSGYNNVSGGDGEGHLYILDPMSGAILEKVDTNVGTTGNPSGLAKISGWANNGNLDATVTHIYGGDLQGNLWRFDLQTSPIDATAMATLVDPGGKPQPITTKPELGMVKKIPDRIVFVGTGSYLGNSDIDETNFPEQSRQVQSIYAIRDTGQKVDARTLTKRTILQSGVTASISGTAIDWANGGWYADFPETKERVTIDPQLVLGTLIVTTGTPQGGTCAPGGTSWIYQFDFATGLAVIGASSLGQKSTSGLIVGNVVFRLPNGQIKGISTSGKGEQDTFGVNINAGGTNSRRTGWRELTQ